MKIKKKSKEEAYETMWHRLRVTVYALEGRIVKSAGEYMQFVRHIIAWEPEAAEKAMKAHLENLKQELIKAMQFFHYPEI